MYQVEKLEEEQAKQKEQAQQQEQQQAQQQQQCDGEEVWVVRRDFHGLGCFCLFVAAVNQVS